jgi:hypothetical protein
MPETAPSHIRVAAKIQFLLIAQGMVGRAQERGKE